MDEKIKKELKEKLLIDIKYERTVCSSMYERFHKWDAFAKMYLIEYSFFCILLSILPQYVPFDRWSRSLLEFMLVSLSIILLIASVCVTSANLQKRAEKTLRIMKKWEKFINDISANLDDSFEYEDSLNRYHQIACRMDRPDKIDIYTARKACEEDGNIHESKRLTYCQKGYYHVYNIWDAIFPRILWLLPVARFLYVCGCLAAQQSLSKNLFDVLICIKVIFNLE